MSKCPAQDVDGKHMLNLESGNRLDVKGVSDVYGVICLIYLKKHPSKLPKQREFACANDNNPK